MVFVPYFQIFLVKCYNKKEFLPNRDGTFFAFKFSLKHQQLEIEIRLSNKIIVYSPFNLLRTCI